MRKKSTDKLKDRIPEKTGRSRGVSLARVIADLNPVLRGWFGYFRHARYRTFDIVDGFVRRRARRPAQTEKCGPVPASAVPITHAGPKDCVLVGVYV